MLKKILHTIDRSFDAGNYENFRLNEFLLVANTFLLFVTMLIIMHDLHWIIIPQKTKHAIELLEIGFGIFFLIEFILRMIYTYIPDKKLFTFYPILQALVILSLLAPTLINIAFLRIIVSIKMLKLYHMRRDEQRQLANNPAFIEGDTLIERATRPLEVAVETVTHTAGKAAQKIAHATPAKDNTKHD